MYIEYEFRMFPLFIKPQTYVTYYNSNSVVQFPPHPLYYYISSYGTNEYSTTIQNAYWKLKSDMQNTQLSLSSEALTYLRKICVFHDDYLSWNIRKLQLVFPGIFETPQFVPTITDHNETQKEETKKEEHNEEKLSRRLLRSQAKKDKQRNDLLSSISENKVLSNINQTKTNDEHIMIEI